MIIYIQFGFNQVSSLWMRYETCAHQILCRWSFFSSDLQRWPIPRDENRSCMSLCSLCLNFFQTVCLINSLYISIIIKVMYNLYVFFNIFISVFSGCPLSFETGGTMGYNCCFILNFVLLHIESPYNFGGTGPILGVKKPL